MAADLSDPAIGSAIESILDPVSPISWLSLAYHPTIEKTLVLISTGFDPWVPRWQELIESRKSEPLFGYGVVAKGRPMREGGEKGVVLVYLPEEVTGVRRARAVVHSRALANRFPVRCFGIVLKGYADQKDYSAIITISHPSQITEEFVRDQVNFYNQPVPTPTSSPVKPRTPAQMGIGLGLGRPSASTPTPGDTASPTIRAIQPSSSSIRSVDRPLPPPPAAPLDLPDNPRLSTPTPPRTVTPPPAGARQSSDNMAQGQHGRKDSLSSRFAKVLPSFTKSNKDSGNNSGGNSPKSPSRFEAFTTGFGTGRKETGNGPAKSGAGEDSFGAGSTGSSGVGGSAQRSHIPENGLTSSLAGPSSHTQASSAVHFEAPRNGTPVQSDIMPTVPRSTASTHPHLAASSRSPEIPQSQSSTSIASIPPPLPPKAGGGRETPPTFSRLHTLGAIIPQTPEGSSRSSSLLPEQHGVSSGSAAFPISPTASAALSHAREKQLDAETRVHDEFRRTEEERTRIRVNSGNRAAGIVRTPTPMMQHGDYDDEEEGLPYDRPEVEEMVERNVVSAGEPDGRSSSLEPDGAALQSHLDSQRQMEEEEARRVAEEKSRADAEEQSRAAAEAVRVREEEERSRAAEALEQERQLELANAREMEEQIRRKEAEDERLREEEEQARILHLQQEQEALAARKAEEEEAALRAKLQAEAEARAEAMQAEREKAKKLEAVREGLNRGKEAGGVMLQGHVTVQTTKSVTWRRRHFQLFPTELRLFKTETDSAPIQTIPLAKGAKVSQTYEESQVQGSFKITTAEEEEFFLFTDSAEEKDILLEGLSMAVWP